MGRKRNLRDKLDAPAERPGWMETINPTAAEAADTQPTPAARSRATQRRPRNAIRRKTYLLSEELIAHIEQLAERERVGINELVRYLLTESIAAVESREWKIPTQPAKRTIVPE